MDCGGVLTDGRLYFSAAGEEMKVFDVRDGQGIVSWHRAGFKSGIIQGGGAGGFKQRGREEAGMEFVRVSSTDKVRDFEDIISSLGIKPESVAYIGDDVGDIELMKRVGFSFAVAAAVEKTKSIAAYVTLAKGGRGAVREVVNMLLERNKK